MKFPTATVVIIALATATAPAIAGFTPFAEAPDPATMEISAVGVGGETQTFETMEAPNADGRVVVAFHNGVPDPLPSYLDDALPFVLEVPQLDAVVMEAGPDRAEHVLRAAAEDPRVAYAERDTLVHAQGEPSDILYPLQGSDPANARLPEAWDIQTGGHDVSIHVLDSGVDPAHADLMPNLCDVGVSFSPQTTDGMTPAPGAVDNHGHGTRVAGLIGAAINNTLGIAGASNSCLTPVRVLSPIPGARPLAASTSGLASWTAAGMVWSADNGADIISMSLAGDSPHPLLEAAVDYAHGKGALLVASAGELSREAYPASYDKVLAVAGNSRGGPWVDLVAEGFNVFTTNLGNTYTTATGSSMATGQVAGIAGLVLAENPGLTNAETFCTVKLTSNSDSDYHHLIRNSDYGQGFVDAFAAVTSATDPPPGCWSGHPELATDQAVVPGGSSFEACWEVSGFGEVDHAQLQWEWSEDETIREGELVTGALPFDVCETIDAPDESDEASSKITLRVHVENGGAHSTSPDVQVTVTHGGA